jgi:formylmethanofuran dehydrogenase subunit B
MPDPRPDLPAATETDGGNDVGAVIEPVVCVACGCLCDDLVLTTNGDRILAIEPRCERAEAWFLEVRPDESNLALALIDGRRATLAEAATRSAELLAVARAPQILGLGGSTNQAVAAAVQLADLIGAVVDPASGPAVARNVALARTGRVSATLGEVKNRADVVVFWGADPVRTHPRHWERYSVLPAGRFVPQGRTGRTVIVVDDRRTATAEQADHFVEIDRTREFEAFWTLRALVKGLDVDPDRVRRNTGLALEHLRRLAGLLRAARYGALFHAPPGDSATLPETAAVTEAANGLVRELNRHTRFVILGIGEPGNPSGAQAVLAWQTGFPASVDLAAGFPESLPGVTSAADRLKRGEADVALVVGAAGRALLDEAPGRPAAIVIGPPATSGATSQEVAVLCHAAIPGLEEAGTVMRADGVALPLRPVRRSRFPTEREWLDAIHDAVLRGETP